ncbi:hypothetical protein QRX60_26960 [Amycolatopsis mongoliensis]|uniref:Uncharacterized protein n=1 Tax=Amycolatopsis mongoliensis TaxID=715475 RepID=A0A9Y2JHD4_9PSEU|nr:hypothetical protein [Amycolatopsis sp. 4-36]WIX97729.1 hypothetical protein QRX60_26960 [Amycolatopsis sp. 4-36]
MKVSSCGHLAPAAGARVCAHLTTDNGPGCFRVLTGVATRYDLLCQACTESEAPDLLTACAGCFERAEGNAYLGWRGSPEILRRDRELAGTWTTTSCAVAPLNDRCLAPLPDGWLARTDAGLVAISSDEPPHGVAAVALPAESPPTGPGQAPAPALHTAADGRFAAAVTDYGRHGVVVDLASGAVVLALDRQDYHTETVRFPVAFLGPLVVAATDWNRLDVFDAATGRLLTERVTTREENPEHYLDYFYGALLPSPSGRSLLADGWVWQPEGIPLVLDCAAWLAGDRHAPEHGQALAFRIPGTSRWPGWTRKPSPCRKSATTSRSTASSSTTRGPGAGRGCSPAPGGRCGVTAACSTSPPKPDWRSGTRSTAPGSASPQASAPPRTTPRPARSPSCVTIG